MDANSDKSGTGRCHNKAFSRPWRDRVSTTSSQEIRNRAVWHPLQGRLWWSGNIDSFLISVHPPSIFPAGADREEQRLKKKKPAHKPTASFAHERERACGQRPELFYRGLGFSEQEPTKAPVEYVVLDETEVATTCQVVRWKSQPPPPLSFHPQTKRQHLIMVLSIMGPPALHTTSNRGE